MFCGKCGSEIDDDAYKCNVCGAPVRIRPGKMSHRTKNDKGTKKQSQEKHNYYGGDESMDEKKNANNQGNAIKTDYLMIRDNIMEWGNTMIQLSSVSSISTITFVHKVPFPMYSLLFVIAGIGGLQYSLLLGIACLAVGILWIYYWWNKNNNPDKTETLNVVMNSGTIYQFLIEDEKFKMHVLRILEGIIADGGKNTIGDINIDLHSSEIHGDLSFMNGRR